MEVDKELKEQFDTYAEINVYFLIDEIGGYIWRMTHDYKHGRIPEKDFQKIKKGFPRLANAQEYGVRQLTRFGVEPTHDPDGKASAQYWAWFYWWKNYIKNLPEKEWRKLETLMNQKQDVSRMFRPPGTWRADVARIQKEQLEAAKKVAELTRKN